MDKLIISVGINGGELSRADTPFLPLTTDEIIDSVVEVHEAGGAVAHVHVRDDEGRPSQDLELYRTVVTGVRERCDIILNLTTDVRREGGDATLRLARDRQLPGRVGELQGLAARGAPARRCESSPRGPASSRSSRSSRSSTRG